MNEERGKIGAFEISAGCQRQGCFRRSRVVILVMPEDLSDFRSSFLCKQHAQEFLDNAKNAEDT